jgi:PAS domain S-box-containing protein
MAHQLLTGAPATEPPVLRTLRDESDMFRQCVDQSSMLVAFLDCELRYLFISESWCATLGKTRDELLGCSHVEVARLSDHHRDLLSRCLRGEVASADRELCISHDGHANWYCWTVRPWRRRSGEIGGLIIECEPVTARVHAEEEVRRSGSLLQSFYESSSFLMGVIELLPDDIRFVNVNQATASIFGCPVGQVNGRTAREFGLSDEKCRFWQEKYRQALQEQRPVSFDVSIESEGAAAPQIHSITVNPTLRREGAHPQFCFVGQDVTEVRRAAAALKQSEERLKNALEASGAGLWELDFVAGRIWLSARCREQFGIPPDETLDTFEDAVQMIHPDDLQRISLQMIAHVEGELPSFEAEYRIRHRHGHWVWILSRAQVAARSDEGEPLRVVGSALDVTARKREEAELQRAKEEAQAASAAKSAFLANVSHEIRTPMTAILGYADLLQDESLSRESRMKFIDTIRRSGRHLLTLINDILDFSKIEAEKMSIEELPCEPAMIVSEVSTLMQARARARGLQYLVIHDGPQPGRILTDPTRVRQILVNLLDNAIKFTERGSVTLRISALPPEAPERLYFQVADTGIGMTAEQLGRIQEPFAQADSSTTRRFGGTGLGLAICRRLAGMLGGKIEILSEVGQGTTSTFWLPLLPRESPSSHALERAEPSPSAPSADAPLHARVLLVEDGEDIQFLVQHILAGAGADVAVAADGHAGVEQARRAAAQGAPFDLILMDVQMPGLDGYAATRLLRARGMGCPIVALTADAMEANRQESRAAGCTEFFPKPIDADGLVQMIRRLLAQPCGDKVIG